MKKLVAVAMALSSSVCVVSAAAQDASGKLIVELANGVTLGKFKYEDATIDISTEAFNPSGSIEYKFGGAPVAIGLEALMSQNDFEGEYKDGHGSLTAERRKFVAFVRFGNKDGTYLRLGYCNFKYDFSDATIYQPDETDVDGKATGDLTTGADVELGLGYSGRVGFSIALGASYFKDAKYEWSYTAIGGDAPGFHSGTAKLDSLSARVRPELSFGLTDHLRLFVNGTLQASAWRVDEDEDEATPDYPGVDIYSAVTAGLRYSFDL